MKLYISDPKVRLSTDAVVAINEILISFLQETIWRTVNQARNEGMISVNLDHLEKILPQLVSSIKATIRSYEFNVFLFLQLLDFA